MRFFCGAAVLLIATTAIEPAHGFSSLISGTGTCCNPRISTSKHEVLPVVALYGLLDDFEAGSSESTTTTTTTTTANSGNSKYETLFEDLVFSTNDPRIGIQDRWEEGCCDVEFVNFLTTKMEEAADDDEEERQAYQDLMTVVEAVRKEKEQEQAEMEAEQAARDESQRQRQEEIAKSVEEQQQKQQKSSSGSQKKMSAAEVLKAANQIQEGIMTASKEALEEEGPSDFMKDAKATVGLSGFNNKGTMRVGGG